MGTAPDGYNVPKTNWTARDIPIADDFNRIEENIYAVEEGQRTIDPSQAPTSNTGSLRQFLDWLANRIKAITGKTNWYDAPSKTLEDLNTHLETHKNESTQNAHLAKNIGIEDTAGNFTATDVEGALAELFQSVSDGKNQLETAITDKGGTVSKTGNVATFDELDNGIRSIPVGDYAVGDTIRDSVLRSLPGGMGVEIWSKTDVGNGYGIAVDDVGNVYVTHSVSSGKAVRKLDPNGNEIWSKTDVAYGRGIVVDDAGNVYVAHYVGSGGKAVRKLDPNGNEIWSKTDVAYGRGIVVDDAGNVYVAHDVSSGGKAVRKLDPNGNEIWSKTDVAYGLGIAVDDVGNVYVTHSVSSGGKAVRKLDPNGNEIWSKTDVGNGLGIAVDDVGNVYVTHSVSSGKAVRKLDPNGNEIWSKTDVGNGYGIAVDDVGNVYVAHNVSSGKAVRKLDGNRYFQIVR